MSVEKQRPEKQKPAPTGGDGDSIFDVAPEPENKTVTVSSGPYQETLPVAGMSVGQVRRKFKDRFDIDSESQAIVNGDDADEDKILKAGEALMFVRHAGEKGGSKTNVVTIEGMTATAETPEGAKATMTVPDLIARISDHIDTGSCVLPSGIKAVLSRGNVTIWVWEKAPAVQKLSWIRPDSPRPFGPGTKYRNVRIGLPYLVIFGVFVHLADGMPYIAKTDECFFRREPLKQLSDGLCFPGLLNCSKFPNANELHPLSWICTQHLKDNPQMYSANPGDRYCGGFEAVRYCLLETSFNLSSEHHEGNSWYGASKKIDERISTVERWEEETKKDPLFVLDVPWIDTKHSVMQVAERIFKRMRVADTTVKSSNDLARVIFNG